MNRLPVVRAQRLGLDDYLVSIRPGALLGHDPPNFVRAFFETVVDHAIIELGGGRHFLRCRLLAHSDLLLRVRTALADAPFRYPPFGHVHFRSETLWHLGGIVTSTFLNMIVIPALYSRYGQAGVPVEDAVYTPGVEREATGG